MNQKSILDMAMGAIKERADYEMARVLENIEDPNTKAAKKRTITLTIEVTPDDARENLRVQVVAKSKLEPTNPIATSLYLTSNENGDSVALEMVPQVPGQTAFDGSEQSEPSVLRIAKRA